jgi:methylase of polypeptide subunit release factors
MNCLIITIAIFLISILVPQSLVTADPLQKNLVFVEQLNAEIAVFPTVFPPNIANKPMREFLMKQDLQWAKDILEIGSGTGILSLIALKKGAGSIIATDINPNAVENTLYNAQQLGYKNRLDARLVSKNDPKSFARIKSNEMFDLIISNLPWYDRTPKNIEDFARFDENYTLLISLLEKLPFYLKENGRAWIEMGSVDGNAIIVSKSRASKLKLNELVRIGNSYTIVEISREK